MPTSWSLVLIASFVIRTSYILFVSRLIFAADETIIIPSEDTYKERKITEVVVEEAPMMLLGENELRRLEPYFLKQAWNWGQLYDKRCTLNPHPGSCSRAFTRWFFYPTFSKCYAFLYGGCGGTANRFASQKACLRSCIPRQRPLPAPIILSEPTLAPLPGVDELNSLLAGTDNETVKAVHRLAEPPNKVTVSSASLGQASPKPEVVAQAESNDTADSGKDKAKRLLAETSNFLNFRGFNNIGLLDRIVL